MGHSFGFVCYLIGLGGNGTLLVIGAYGGGVLSNTLLDFLIFFASVAVRFRSVWSGSVRFGSVGRKVCDWHVVIAGDGVLSVEHSFVFLLCFILWGGREQRWIFIGLSLIYLHFLRPFPCFFFHSKRPCLIAYTHYLSFSLCLYSISLQIYTLNTIRAGKGLFIDYTWRGFTCIVKEKLKSSCRLTLLSSLNNQRKISITAREEESHLRYLSHYYLLFPLSLPVPFPSPPPPDPVPPYHSN